MNPKIHDDFTLDVINFCGQEGKATQRSAAGLHAAVFCIHICPYTIKLRIQHIAR